MPDSAPVQVSIAAGGYSYLAVGLTSPDTVIRVFASAPIRMLALTAFYNVYVQPPAFETGSVPPAPANFGPLGIATGIGSLSWTWQTGTAMPAATRFNVAANYYQSVGFTVSVATGSGGQWLSATPSSATTCGPPGPCTLPIITASVDPTGLAPGIYRGSITLTPIAPAAIPNVTPIAIGVALTVSAVPFVNTIVDYASFPEPGVSNPESYVISSDVFPGAFSVAVRTDSGGNWLSATASPGTAPAVATVSANLSGLAPGRYAGEVILTGSGDTVVIAALATVYGGVQLADQEEPMQFSVRAGDPAPPAQVATVTPECLYSGCPASGVPASIPFAASVTTSSGENWLAAVPASDSVSVTVNPAGLAPGTYIGAVTLTSSAAYGPTQFPVILTVWSEPAPALSASLPGLVGMWQQGQQGPVVPNMICVSAGSFPVAITALASTLDGGNWLSVTVPDPVTYTCLEVAMDGSNLALGTYSGNIVVTIPGQSLTIPVTLVVFPFPERPLLGSVVNGASAVQGSVAPGEIATIFGVGIGPQSPNSPPTQVFFDQTPATLIYASPSQVNAVVPSQVAGNPIVNVQVMNDGQSTAWTIPVAAASPAIFTLDSSGQGPAAVLNQDNSVNSPANPAARGSVIQIFGTGVGVQNSAPVSVTIGGVSAFVEYAGPAPGAVSGLFQVNAVVAAGVTPGPAVPITFSVGSFQSQSGVTVAVQ
ncbi:MAG: BACON domain-containing protein [Bryobacteraceae bacterium]